MSSDLQARIDAIAWYHEFDFPNGLRARSRAPDIALHRRIWRLIERQLEGLDFRGKTVLDIGAWDGLWSFYAERRGASHVLATDDLSQNWSSGRGIHLARELLASHVEIRQDVSVYALDRLHRKFDVVLCLGVYYHLVDPFLAFAQIRHCCQPDAVVLFEGDVVFGGPLHGASYWRFGDPGFPLFLPTLTVLHDLLRAAYLDVQSHARMRARLTRWLVRLAPWKPTLLGDRVVTVCRPFEGDNPLHPYPPPFGLARYDARWRGSRE